MLEEKIVELIEVIGKLILAIGGQTPRAAGPAEPPAKDKAETKAKPKATKGRTTKGKAKAKASTVTADEVKLLCREKLDGAPDRAAAHSRLVDTIASIAEEMLGDPAIKLDAFDGPALEQAKNLITDITFDEGEPEAEQEEDPFGS